MARARFGELWPRIMEGPTRVESNLQTARTTECEPTGGLREFHPEQQNEQEGQENVEVLQTERKRDGSRLCVASLVSQLLTKLRNPRNVGVCRG